jgi:two-component system, LytTR family, response regulator
MLRLLFELSRPGIGALWARKKALNRARMKFKGKFSSKENLCELLESTRKGQRFLQRLIVRSGGRVLFLKAPHIDWIEASGNYVTLHTGKESHLLRTTMNALEPKLDPQQFVRNSSLGHSESRSCP